MLSLNEYKNVSDDVYQFAVEIYNKILDDADIQQMQKSHVNGFLFVQNTLLLDNSNIKWIFNNINSLKLTYVLYVSETTREYNYIMQNIDADANSESDYDNKSITIVSGYIDGYIASDFLSNICHEVNHLYEYDKGREKRVDLYDKVRELIGFQKDEAYIVGNAIYYSFHHEIDAFVHEFYGFLNQEKSNHLNFEQLLKYSEYMNALSIMYLLNLDPKDIQVIFLESINIQNDPFYDLYKYLISRGGDPFHVRTLKKKYHITSAIHIPINWDSPCFISSSIPSCQYPSLAYKYFNDLVDYYMDIKPYKDSFISDNDVYYYPKSVIEHHKANKNFKKIITFQWRRVWPRGRSSQGRILGNGPELVEKLSKSLPENYLIRLIDTAGLSISEQISIMRTTDYFIGVHGAGLFLGIFTPNHCPFHEVLSAPNMNGLLLMGALSGHRTFSDVIQANNRKIDGSDYIFFNENAFVNRIIQRMKSTDFI